MSSDYRVEILGLDAYRDAPSGEGPLAHEWADKPHRLVYDLVGAVGRLREERDALAQINQHMYELTHVEIDKNRVTDQVIAELRAQRKKIEALADWWEADQQPPSDKPGDYWDIEQGVELACAGELRKALGSGQALGDAAIRLDTTQEWTKRTYRMQAEPDCSIPVMSQPSDFGVDDQPVNLRPSRQAPEEDDDPYAGMPGASCGNFVEES